MPSDPEYVIMRPGGEGWHLAGPKEQATKFEGIRSYVVNCKSGHLLGFVTTYQGLRRDTGQVLGGCLECLANYQMGFHRPTTDKAPIMCSLCSNVQHAKGLCKKHYMQAGRRRNKESKHATDP